MFSILSAALRAFLVWGAPKIAVLFGLYAVANTVTKPMFDWLQAQVLNQIGQAGQYAQYFNMLGVTEFLSIIFSAYVFALGVKVVKSAASHT